jgi:hypothetical protein
MTTQEIIDQLRSVSGADDFAEKTTQLTNTWSSAGVALEAVDPILQFMEQHPNIDFGTPGALVHFVERFHRKGYEEKLIESVQRKPVAHTVWMLNRLINGTEKVEERKRLIAIMSQVTTNPSADTQTVELANHFLEGLSL